MGYNEWLDIDVLEAYLDGNLDAKTMHQVERASLDDPFMADALAGLTAAKKRKQSLSILQKQLQERVAQKPIEAKRWRLTSQRLSIAATAAVLFVVASVFFFMRERYRLSILQNQPKTVQVEIAPQPNPSANSNSNIEEATKDQSLLADQNTIESAIKKGAPIATLKPKSTAINPIMSTVEPTKETPLQEVMVQRNDETERILLKKSNDEQPQSSIATLSGKAEGVSAPNKISNGNANTANLPLELQRIAAQQQQQAAARMEVDKAPKDNLAKETVRNVTTAYAAAKQNAADTVAKSATPVSAVFATTQPVVGWDVYKTKLYEYVYKNTNQKTTGIPTVKLGFTVKLNGDPTKIKVLKSGGKVYDDIAIKALKQNGKWTYSRNSSNEGTLEVVFSF